MAAMNPSANFIDEQQPGVLLKMFSVSVDAFVMFAAFIFTSYVGVGGFVSRWSGDRCRLSLYENDMVPTILFMGVCASWMVIKKRNGEHYCLLWIRWHLVLSTLSCWDCVGLLLTYLFWFYSYLSHGDGSLPRYRAHPQLILLLSISTQ